ncbi:UDP-N-acetylglucosamine 4,6-dehydratase family protein [Paramaledivibacter caminithermalis]|jgi:FlaA1/EpsC-like NDP-sugar epimerase|uniref:Polysaccharide biosynthesis protein n=1 Tax=Paramaledivibacter caminithermalis (strain DSM 15212 / CIP 107654 / DViRD3) TaxID=1121301 RepID=A0A1M6L630_PARC5|nr:UDP-N-acetylglucosamine 4,6-dehydratase family protein [Paramaledivibacter caminithermalis]SHJ66650.1 Polysaccharide biosynthesis protein [Paramaledivibacter caminithermalis DSM 15212]
MFKNKTILVIGGTGTIGKALVKKLLTLNAKVVRVLGRDEYKQYIMQEELRDYKNIRYFLGDVRDKYRLSRAMQDVDIVFNLAALKHVPACEYNPFEAVKTNVIGTQNVIECAIENNVEKVIYTSSDKAVSPTNTMGATKLLAERLMAAANNTKGSRKTVFASVRFGNVIGSRGSVVPLWEKQIIEKRKITITNLDMTRFMMSIDEAVNLTLKATEIAKGGETFVLKMPVIKLSDLANVVIEKVCSKHRLEKDNIGIEVIGTRAGEKMYEELMTEDEALNVVELDDMFIMQPLYESKDDNGKHNQGYNSHNINPISKKEIMQILESL